MAGKRKRKRSGNGNDIANEGNHKYPKNSGVSKSKDSVVKDAVLAQYYPRVMSLREYLVSKLPPTSKLRKKKILAFGKNRTPNREGDDAFSKFIDQTIVGLRNDKEISPQERSQQWTSFSQRLDTSDSTLANITGAGIFSQSEVVDFAIWLLFQKSRGVRSTVQHLLCQGYRKDLTSRAFHRDENVFCNIPGLVLTQPNTHVKAMKEAPWPRVLTLLGKDGERTMVDLILDCGIFLAIESGHGSYYQLSGHPLGDLQLLSEVAGSVNISKVNQAIAGSETKVLHTPASIVFVRNRMLYARAALNAQGGVRFGLRHIHVLNRFKYLPEVDEIDTKKGEPPKSLQESTLRVLMYVFPRQFGLHNVFTSKVNTRETVQPFKDYTLREDEIVENYPKSSSTKIPKRLRGKVVKLIQKLQKLHKRCSYKSLLEYYCPVTNGSAQWPGENTQGTNSTAFETQEMINGKSSITTTISSKSENPVQKPSMMDHATPISKVFAFCRAVLSALIPHEFWGSGEEQSLNEAIFYRNVCRFIELRRFENLSLHEVLQGLKIVNIDWLGPPEAIGRKISQSDMKKRLEIFHEFIYYIFDSILIPLIRANFHVTESNIHRYRLFFFRHDVWRTIAEPALTSLKLNMFEEIKLDKAQRILASRTLGFSQVRLLPKETGVRPIMNLRRRPLHKSYKNVLGSSINSVLAPVYNALTYERASNPTRLGSTLFSVGDLYTKLKAFKATLRNPSKPLYFAKVDVKAAFDTIPQVGVMGLMKSLPTESIYCISKHVEIKPGEGYKEAGANTKPRRKWIALARPPTNRQSFKDSLESDVAVGRRNTVFIESINHHRRNKDDLMELLAEHVQNNMVKIGKKFYRQKEGIPQGSVVSSLLCNFFYADLEAKHLHFLESGNSLLLRLIDDFLLITTESSHAKRFLQVMHDGVPEYGVRVNPDKTLVNFEATINDKKVPRLIGSRLFPYCGSFVDTNTLDITKDRERKKDMAIADSLTVEFSKMPGKSFHRKVLNTFKIQAHAMFLDTAHNSLATVLFNIHSAFHESATKLWTYARCLPSGKQPCTKLLIKTVEGLIDLAFVLLKSKGKNTKNAGYTCAVSKVQVEWLAINAFKDVLQVRQSKYGKLLEWVNTRIERLWKQDAVACQRMKRTISSRATID